jgi:phage terminase large subunit-like protein
MANERRRLALLFILLVVAVSRVSAAQYTANQYIRDVQSGKQVACKWVKLAVQRHVDDLKRAKKKLQAFPFYYDEQEAHRAIDFVQELRHTQGEWANPKLHDTRLHLEPWQQFITSMVFGWRRSEDGCRRFAHVYEELARKNGKTFRVATYLIYCTAADSPIETGAEAYCIATKKDQARKAWSTVREMIETNPDLKAVFRTYKQHSTIVLEGTATQIRLMGKDSRTEDGMNPSFVLVDEYHAHPDHGMLHVMESAIGARKQPLTYIITTAGFDKSSVCHEEEHMLVERILERSIDPIPEHVFGIIYTLDEGDDWTDRKVWIKANPNLGVSVYPDALEKAVVESLSTPTKLNDTLTKNFNVWTQAVTRWIQDEKWMACAGEISVEALKGRPCYVGLDLSTTVDITSYALCFPPIADGERYRLVWRFFIPEEGLLERERRDRVPYSHWRDQGLVITTPGDVVDYDLVMQELDKDLARFSVSEIGFDPWHGQEVSNHYTQAGIKSIEIRQTYSGMSAYTSTFETKTLAAELLHDGNPVVRWMLSNTEVKSDRQGNIAPMKPRRGATGKRIDGVVAAIMALGRAVVNHESGRSVYEDRGVVVL